MPSRTHRALTTAVASVLVATLVPLAAAQAANDWWPSGSLADARRLQTETVLTDRRVLVIGGDGGSADQPVSLSSVEQFDPQTMSWAEVAPLTTPRSLHSATLLKDGTVLVVGGRNDRTALASAELYQPASASWSAAGLLATPRTDFTATLLQDGRVLVVGGAKDGAMLDSAEVYDPGTGAWALTGSLATAREDHTASLLPDGRVLVTGGDADNERTAMTSAELYDPASGTWAAAARLRTARIGHTATLVTSAGLPQILITGGHQKEENQILSSAETYAVTTDSWQLTGTMGMSRTGHTAVALASGHVLVAGGVSTTCHTAFSVCTIKTAELFDPQLTVWTALPDMDAYRVDHTAALLQDGRMLIVGGTGITATVGPGQRTGLLRLTSLFQP
jgi:N-acetylneuraminic acid mutarotase